MKSFTSILALGASLALVRAQAVFNETTGQFSCPIANATYCGGDSLSTNIIIRCDGFVGYPGNCDDNLDGEFPQGDSYSPCYATSPSSGIAACSKNCVVYGGSGDTPSFTLPGCVPTATSSSITTVPATSIAKAMNATSFSTLTATVPITANVTIKTIVPIVTGVVGTGHVGSASSAIPTYHTTGLIPFPSNGTSVVHPSGSGASTGFSASTTGVVTSGLATATPVSPPTSTVSSVVTFSAAANSVGAGSALAVVGLIFAAVL